MVNSALRPRREPQRGSVGQVVRELARVGRSGSGVGRADSEMQNSPMQKLKRRAREKAQKANVLYNQVSAQMLEICCKTKT